MDWNWGIVAAGIWTLTTAGTAVGLSTLLGSWQQSRDADRREQREDLLSVRDHQRWTQQQWWQRKVDAYNQIIDALWQLLENARDEMDYYDARDEGRTPRRSGPFHDFQKNDDTIRRLSDIGVFLISPDATATLQDFRRQIEQLNKDSEMMDGVDVAASNCSLISKCLDNVRHSAMVDLGIE